MAKYNYTEIEIKEILSYFLAPHTIYETAIYFNVTSKVITRILKEQNIQNHPAEIIKALRLSHIQQSCLKKYGVKNYPETTDYLIKSKQTSLAKYGVEYASSTEEVKIKVANKKMALYGSKNYNNRKKAAETCILKYSVDNPSKVPEIKNKKIQTSLNNFGETNPAKTQIIKNKIKITNNNKYNCDYYVQSDNYAKLAHRRYYYNSIYFDSSWELALWIYAKDHNEQIEREPVRLEYYVDDKKHYYFPDFLYQGKLVEIKGDYLFDMTTNKLADPYHKGQKLLTAKYLCMLQNNVTILFKKDIQFILDYVYETYGKNYLKQFKNKKEPAN